VRDRAEALAEIAEALPEIIRGLGAGHPMTGREWELTLAQMRALQVVGDQAVCTMGELAHRLGISLSAATGLADRLVEQGLVEREADPADRRLVCLRVAAAGKRARAIMRKEKRRRVEAMLGGLSGPELEQIVDSLALLRRAVSKSPNMEEQP